MLTVSVVKFPCVNKAKFCKNSIHEINDNGDNMTNDEAKQTFIESVTNAVKNLTQSTEVVEETEETDIQAVIDEKIGALKAEIQEEIKANQESILAAIKEGLRTAPKLTKEETTPVDDKVSDEGIVPPIEEETVAGKVKQPLPEFEDEPEPVADEPETEDEPAEPTEPVEEAKPEEPAEPATEEKTEPAKKEPARKGQGGKSFKKEEKETTIPYAEPSAQISRKSGKLEQENKKMTIKRNEDDIIYDSIKKGMSTKGINMQEVDLTGTGLTATYENDVFLSLLNNKYAQEVYKASFGEDDSNKAILTTSVFSTFVTKLIQEEPIFLDANYQTGHHGKGYIYDLDNGTYDTEDGHLPENFYFDKDPADDEFDIDVREVRCYTQRRRVTISDRQRLSNVYGDDLVNKVLEISRKKLFRGVYAARVWSDTTLANSVDKQYRRQNGLIKQAGQQLDGATDVNLDKAVDIFRTMFYALPEEARTPSDYCFYVPTNVYLAYYDYISESKRESRYEWVSQEQSLFWNNIPIKVSPTLNRADMKTLCYSGDSAVLLTSPSNKVSIGWTGE